MKYFKLGYDYNKSDGSIFLSIDEDSFDFFSHDMFEAKKEIKWNKNIKVEVDKAEGNKITDYICNDLGWLIVTEKFKNLLQEFNIGDVRFYPINIDDEVNVLDLKVYAVHICTVVDALNLKYSTYSVYKTEKTEMLSVIKYAIDESKVENYDLFKLENDRIPIFISERLAKAMKKAKITGCNYGYVTVV